MLETLKRTELLLFLCTTLDRLSLRRPSLVQTQALRFIKSTANAYPSTGVLVDFDPDKLALGNLGVLGWNFINSAAVGYLEKKSDSWFRDWTEKFCVLTNVGLLYYDDPQKRPTNLIPTLDAKVVPVPEATYQRRWVFQIKSLGA